MKLIGQRTVFSLVFNDHLNEIHQEENLENGIVTEYWQYKSGARLHEITHLFSMFLVIFFLTQLSSYRTLHY